MDNMKKLQRPLFTIQYQERETNKFVGKVVRNDIHTKTKVDPEEPVFIYALDRRLLEDVASILDRDWDEKLKYASFNATARQIGQIEMLLKLDTIHASTD